MLGAATGHTYSKSQAVIALSSGEAELLSIVKASVEALGLQSLMLDFGIKVELEVRSDATAAIGMVARLGLGKVRHLSVSDLWVQYKARTGEIPYSKVDGSINVSDAMTKAVPGPLLRKHLTAMGIVALTGRSRVAPTAKCADGLDGSQPV